MNDGLIGVAVAIAVATTSIFAVAIASTPKELVVIFGEFRIEYRQF